MTETDVIVIPPRKLSARRQRFAEEYLVDFNKTQAAIRAGYAPDNAGQEGYRLYKNADVQAEIARLREAQDKDYQHRIAQKYEVLARLTEIARGDIGDLLDEGDDIENLSVRRAKQLGKSHLVRKVKVYTTITQTPTTNDKGEAVLAEVQTTSTELELYSAHEALRDIGKYYALFTDVLSVPPEKLAELPDEELLRIASGKK